MLRTPLEKQLVSHSSIGQPTRLVVRTDQSEFEFEEVQLENNGKWSPKAVFRIMYLNAVLSVEMKLESTNDGW